MYAQYRQLDVQQPPRGTAGIRYDQALHGNQGWQGKAGVRYLEEPTTPCGRQSVGPEVAEDPQHEPGSKGHHEPEPSGISAFPC